MPALIVALALTLTRSVWVGTCVGVGAAARAQGSAAAGGAAGGRGARHHPGAGRRHDAHVLDVRRATTRPTATGSRCCIPASRWSAIIRSPASAPTWSRRSTRRTASPGRCNPERPPAQRADADRRRARPAGAGHLAGFIAYVARDLLRRLQHGRDPSLAGAGLAALAAMLSRRTVRVQLRRLRVPDALSRPDHAPVRRPTGARTRPTLEHARPGARCHRPHSRHARTLLTRSSRSSPDSRSSSSAT